MAARKSSRVNRKYKTRYCVQNWPEYERGLRARGDVTIWFSDEAVAAWTPPPTGLRGGQRQYSNLAILTSLTLRLVFHLPLRQTEGFVGSLLRLMGLDLKAPDHSTLSCRGEHVEVPPLCRDHDGPIHVVVDSTGLKISGAGDWSSRKHRKGKGRRGWRKLHIGVDDNGLVVAALLTESRNDDASVVPDLLEQIDGRCGVSPGMVGTTGDWSTTRSLEGGRRASSWWCCPGEALCRPRTPRAPGRNETRTSSGSRRSAGGRG